MKTTKHTTGAWISRNNTIWNADMTASIAVIHPYDLGDIEAQANAKLIAASPKLLKTCQTVLELLRLGKNNTYMDNLLEEVIKQATE